MIEASGLTKRYGDRLALDGLSFQVKPGRVTGFLEPNGAGKSTSNAEIASDLVVAEQTVKTHVGRILTKLHLRDRTQAAIFAYEMGLFRPGR
jgi:ABC-type Na+ transport system ATPase subunit NatA